MENLIKNSGSRAALHDPRFIIVECLRSIQCSNNGTILNNQGFHFISITIAIKSIVNNSGTRVPLGWVGVTVQLWILIQVHVFALMWRNSSMSGKPLRVGSRKSSVAPVHCPANTDICRQHSYVQVVLRTYIYRPLYPQSTKYCSDKSKPFMGAPAFNMQVSCMPVEANAAQEPQMYWFRTGVTSPV